ncbi:Flagellar basal-body rod protein FlgG [bioreactor metagenome]|uniref:Flagellar basal-body rod protein FlgG n=1 Tax=bioreactor metagenome TaxID=1076179 RepID=A0A644SXG8_9ZZZZ|nr:flagellar basal-body rod protein FlgF [Desulfitobacterium hafniense]MEA5021265.1 flagellar basal-body rod protein FlgF [Desulfitobacterium hafniense]
MIKGLYTGAAGMLAAQTQSEIIADNVANIRTPGYKGEEASNKAFPEMLMMRTSTENEIPGNTLIGGIGTGVVVDQITRMNVQGVLQTTDIPTDLALTAEEVFLVVDTPNGERYTRNGQLQLNSEGMLQTADGYPVLGEEGPIGPLSKNFQVDAQGGITDQGVTMDRLRLVQIPAVGLLREGQSLYASNQPVQEFAGSEAVLQGTLEGSNVNLPSQMVKMITVMRAYEANQKVIQTHDATLEKAVNEIGRIV